MAKILTYNLRNGAEKTYDVLVEFVKQEAPDILCIQEANGWADNDSQQIKNFAKQINFPYFSLGNSNTDFKLVTFSKLPIVKSRCITEGFWHSALKTVILWNNEQLTIWNVHLDPRTPINRQKEVTRLLSYIQRPLQKVIITGDFNSISRADIYPDDTLKKLLAVGIKKFGITRLSYNVMSSLEKFGLIDVAAVHNATFNTVPTDANEDDDHSITLRLDYFIVSPDINSKTVNVSVPKNTYTNRISDHYPIVLELE